MRMARTSLLKRLIGMLYDEAGLDLGLGLNLDLGLGCNYKTKGEERKRKEKRSARREEGFI